MLQRYSFALAVLLCAACVLLPDSAFASTYYVSTTGANTNAGSEAAPWRTIQYAISTSATVNGDVIIVEEGVYLERISFGTKSVTVASRHLLDSDTSHIALTVIDGSYGGTVVTITSDVTLHGLTVRHGGDVSDGGGIHISNADPVLSYLVVEDNWSTLNGGGIYLTGSDAVISNSTIADNSAGGSGGGMYLNNSPATVQLSNLTITDNSADDSGGGLYVYLSEVAISNTTISDNSSANEGGGLYVHESAATMTDMTIDGNTATNSGGGVAIELADVVVRGGTIGNNRAQSGGGVFVYNEASAALVNVTVSDNTALNEGGGLYGLNAELLLDSSSVTDNTVLYGGSFGYSGGGICAVASNLYVSTATISGNKALFGGGGGIALIGDPDVVMPAAGLPAEFGGREPGIHNAIITGNGAVDGGGVYITQMDVAISNSTISENTVPLQGGGIYCEVGSLMLSNSTLNNNTAIDQGGAIYIMGDPCGIMATALLVKNSALTNNYAGPCMSSGGGLYAENTEVYVDSTVINGNYGYSGGGGVAVIQPMAEFIPCQPVASASLPPAFNGAVRGFTNTEISNNGAEGNGGGIYMEGVTEEILSNCTINNNTAAEYGGGIYFTEGILVLSNSTVDENTAQGNGGGIFINASPCSPVTTALLLDSSSVSDNTSWEVEGGGGGIYAELAELYVSTATISGNYSDSRGGGVMLTGDIPAFCQPVASSLPPVFEGRVRGFVDTHIDHNGADGSGGGIFMGGISEELLSNCTVSHNTADYNGGGMAIYDGRIVLDQVTVEGNYSDYQGGGIYAEGADIHVTSATISSNGSSEDGGGLWWSGASRRMPESAAIPSACDLPIGLSNSTIEDNTTGGSGGGLYISQVEEINLINSTISDNSAMIHAGGLYVENSVVYIDSVSVLTNESGGSGGGIFLYQCDLYATSATVEANTAALHGGGLFTEEAYDPGVMMPSAGLLSCLPGISSSSFNYNTALDGGGIYGINHTALILSNVTMSHNSVPTHGSGIYVENLYCLAEGLTVQHNEAGGSGGGMYVKDAGLHLVNSTLSENSAGGFLGGGGAIYTEFALAFMYGLTVNDNYTGGSGGGILLSYNDDAVIDSSTVNGNAAAGDGGGISVYFTNAVLSNMTVAGNSAGGSGGGIYKYSVPPGMPAAAILNVTPFISNAAISGNYAGASGGCDGGGGLALGNTDLAVLLGVTLTGNNAPNSQGGGLLAAGADVELVNSIVQNNSADTNENIARCSAVIQAYYSMVHTVDVDSAYAVVDCEPLFIDPVDPLSAPTTSGNLRLLNTSPAIGSGVESIALAVGTVSIGTTDIEGNTHGIPPDIGAYENALAVPQSSIAALDDEALSCNGEHVTIDVLANDTNAVDGSLSILEYTQGTNGNVCLDDGMLKYTPEVGFEGVDYFTYRVTTASCGVASTATVAVTVSRFGIYALDLNGDDEYVEAPAGTWFDGDFTIEALVRVDNFNSWSRLMDFGNGQDSNNVYVALSEGLSGHVVLGVHEGGNNNRSILVSPEPLPIDEWVHLAFVLDGNEGRIYKNGELWAADNMSVTPLGNETSLNYIGRSNWDGDYYADAQMSEFRIWDTSRTQSEIQLNMYVALNGDEDGLALYYPFNDMRGSTAHDGVDGNDGSLQNCPNWINGEVFISGNTIVNTTTSVYTIFPQEDDGDYFWSVSGGTIISDNGHVTVEILWDDVANGTVSVTAANAHCSVNASLDVRIFHTGPTYYVCTTTGSDCNGTGSPGNPFETIAYGIQIAGDGQVVLVCPGTYEENIEIYENITVASWHYTTGDTTYIAETIISGDNCGGAVVYIEEVTSATLSGFTVQNGVSEYAGGIEMYYASPTLSHLVVRNNEADYGGGIGIWGRAENGNSPILSNITVQCNTAEYEGGGIFILGATPRLSDIVVSHNTVEGAFEYGEGFGGGIFISGQSFEAPMPSAAECPVEEVDTLWLSNVTVSNNSAGTMGGGIYIDYNTAIAENLHVYGNSALIAGGGMAIVNSSIAFDNLTVTSNTLTHTEFGDPEEFLSLPIIGGGGVWVSGLDLRTVFRGVMPSAALEEEIGTMEVSITNATISGNFGGYQGGGVMVLSGDLFNEEQMPSAGSIPFVISSVSFHLSNSTVAENTVSEYGGAGGLVVIAAHAHLDSVVVRGNVAGTAGGMALITEHAHVRNCVVDSNSAVDGPGGGVYVSNWNIPALPSGSESPSEQEEEDGVFIEGTVVQHNTADNDGAGIYVDENTVQLSNMSVSGNSAGSSGGGLYLEDANVLMNTVGVNNNEAYSGGGLYISNTGLELTNSTVNNNSVISNGGGVYVTGTNVDISTVTVSGNGASGNGAGIYISGGAAIVANSTVSNNSTEGNGGAIYLSNGSISLSTVHADSNSAGGSGGGIYVNSGGIGLTNSTVNTNSASGSGGGIYVNTGGGNLLHSAVNNNTAGEGGGGVAVFSSSMTLNFMHMRGNTAVEGGGLAIVGADLHISNALISGNYSTMSETSCSGGGGIGLWGSDAKAHLVNSTITGNMAESQGGGVLVNFGSELLMANSIVWGNEAAVYFDVRRCSTGYISAAHTILPADSPLDEAISVIGCDPFFVNPATAGNAPTSAGNYDLQDISPAVGRGVLEVVLTNSTMSETTLTASVHDIEGMGRSIVVPDLGAYENDRELQLGTIAASGDSVEACINTTIPVLVLANDTNASVFSLQISDFSQGTSGTVTIDETGNEDILIYTPNTSFTGTDSFTYTIEAGGICSVPTTATVHIVVKEAFALTVTGATSLFAGEQAVYTVTNSSVFATYHWSAEGGFVVDDSSSVAPTIKWNTSGSVVTTGVVHLTVTDIRGCVTTATLDVQVIPFIPVVIEGDEETVGDTTGVYSTGGIDTTGASFVWTISEGGTIVTSTTGASVVVEWEDVDEPTTGTITVAIITAGGGVGSTTFVVTIYPRPILHITGSSDPCSGAIETYSAVDIRNTGSILEWSVEGGAIIGATTGATIVVQWNTTTMVTAASVTVIGQEPHDFDGTTTLTVTLHPNPMLSITGSTDACSGAVHTYTVVDSHGTNSGYSWSVAGGTIIGSAALSNVTVQWNTTNSPAGGSLTVIATSPEGCASTIASAVQINPNPALSISGDMSACSGAIHSYGVSDANNTGSEYNWSVSGGVIIGSSTTGNVTVQWNTTNSATGGTLTVMATTLKGCASTIASAVQINPNPALSIGGDLSACSGAIHSYSVSDANNTGSAYNWSVSGGTIIGSAALSNVTVQWNTTNSATGGTLTVIATNSEGCASTIASAVQINPNPVLSISGDLSACSGAIHSYSVSDANNTGSAYNWSVSGGTIIGSAAMSNVTVQWNTTNSTTGGTLTVIAMTSESCTATTASAVQINPNPMLSISGDTGVCSESTKSYSVSDANNTGSEYNWSVSGGTIIGSSTTSNVTVQWNLANSQASGTLTVMATTVEGCTSTIASTVQINPNPLLTITGAASVCADSTHTYSVSDANNTKPTYNWEVSGGVILSGQGTTSPTIRWDGAGAASLSVSALSASGCSATTNILVTVNPNPTPVITGDLTFCPDGNTVLDAGAGFSAYLWSNGMTTRTVTVATAGVYTVTVHNASGCSATTSASVVELPPVFSHAGTDLTICTGGSVQLDGRGTSSIGDMIFKWSPATGLSNPNIADPIASPTTTTIYTLTVTDGFGCSAIDQMTVTVMPAMLISASGDGVICRGGSTQLQATGGVSYSWSPAEGLDNAFIANPVASPMTTTLYTVTITNANGCTTTASVTVTISSPVADAGPGVSVCAGGSVQLQATGGVSYQWSPALGLNNPNIAAPVASPSTTTTYTVTVTNGLGCSSVTTVTVTVQPVQLYATVLLQGAYDNGELQAELQNQGLIPAVQPYNVAPYNYAGNEQMATTSANVVDWVLVELRSNTNPESITARRAALLLSDGRIVDTDGASGLSFSELATANGYYVVVRHRNHLSVMSAVPAVSDGNCGAVYDLGVSSTAAYQDYMPGQTMLDATHFGMTAGDVDQDGVSNAVDRVEVRNATGQLGYLSADLSLDGIVNSLDRVLARDNSFKTTQVP